MLQKSKKQIFIALCVCVGSVISGIAAGWSAPILPKFQDLKQSPLPYVIDGTEVSWIASSIYIGVIIGPYLTGVLSNLIGRQPCLVLGGMTMALSFAVLATAVNLTMVLIGRIMSGVGCGFIFVTELVYVSEIASTNIRGALLSLTGVASSTGTLICFSICPYVSYSSASYFALALSLLFTAGMLLVPETPVFYLLKGNKMKAEKVLSLLGRTEDLDDLLTKKDRITSKKQDWIEIFSIKNNRKTLFIALTLHILQNCSGGWVLLLFSTSIFDLIQSGNDANVSTIVIGITMLVASCITPMVVDKYGRKVLLLLSTAVSCLSMMLLGVYFFLEHTKHWMIPHLQLLPVITLVIFYLFYNCGFGIIPGTLMSEMFQSNVRGPGSTLTLTTGWLFSWMISTTFGYTFTAVGIHTTFWVYSIICFVGFVFTAVFVPETKGKTFAEIQCILSK